MKRRSRFFALALSILMVPVLFSSCGNAGGAAEAETAPSATPSVPDASDTTGETTQSTDIAEPAGGSSALDQLLSKADKLPLGGLQPSYLESRAEIDKALPFQKKGDDLTIGWCSASQAMDFFVEMVSSAKELAEEYGYTFLYQVASHDLNAQQTQIENYLTQGVDILVVNAVDIDATLNYYQQAVSQGIPVIVVGPTGGQHEYPIITSVVSASFEAGYVVGNYVAEKLYDEFGDSPLEVSFVLSRAGDADSNSRCCGFVSGYLYRHAELSGNPYPTKWDATLDGYETWVACRDSGSSSFGDIINLLGYGAAGSTDTTALQNVAGDLLTTHRDMNLIFVETACRITQEIEQHNLVAGEDLYVCYGGNGENYILEDIKNGTVLATATNSPYYTGAGIIELIHDIVDEGFDANNLPATLYTPSDCVNVDNIDEFYNPNLLFAPAQDWKIMTIDEYNAANAN